MSQTHFDEVAAVYDETLPPHVTEHYLAKRARFVLAACPPPGRVLDVGCGTGALAARLAKLGYQVAGLDPSEGMLGVMGERAPEVEAIQGSATQMPFADGEFDLSLSVATMHHIADPGAVRLALGEMVRVVRPGGRVIVWDHNPRNPYWPYLMRRVPQDSGDERLVGVDELLAGLETGAPTPCSWLSSGWFRTSRRGRCSAPQRRSSERPSAHRSCAAAAPTTSSSR